jgi:branched-subunit amino acid ABC-type transport system permease component
VASDRRTHRLLAGLLLGGAVVVSLAGPAGAQDQDATGVEREITVVVVDRQGTRDRGDDEPVSGARIVITDATDEEIEEVETDDEGRATILLPDEGAFTATLDLDSLPEDAGLPREGGEVVELGRSRVLNFVVGDRERAVTTTIDRLPQLIFNGLSFGLIIAICSVGLSLIYGTTGLVNFSHGELVTWGAMVAWFINVDHGVPLLPAAILAILIGAATGAVIDRLLWRPLRSRGMSLVAMMIVSIGFSLATRSVFQLLFGGVYRPYAQFNVQQGIDIGPITTSPKDVWVIGIVLIVIVAVASLLQYSRIGKAMRAVSDNPDLAASSGIDVEHVIIFVWALGAGLAALGGILFGIQQQVQFEMGFKLLLLMFAGITLGGLGTAYGALVGSIVVGLFVELSTLFIPTELKSVGALGILIVVLLFRPQGILGTPERIG